MSRYTITICEGYAKETIFELTTKVEQDVIDVIISDIHHTMNDAIEDSRKDKQDADQ